MQIVVMIFRQFSDKKKVAEATVYLERANLVALQRSYYALVLLLTAAAQRLLLLLMCAELFFFPACMQDTLHRLISASSVLAS